MGQRLGACCHPEGTQRDLAVCSVHPLVTDPCRLAVHPQTDVSERGKGAEGGRGGREGGKEGGREEGVREGGKE